MGLIYGISATALNHLIVFLHHVFLTMAIKSLPTLATTFPTSLYMFQKHFGSNIVKFEKYVICTKCGSLHCYKDCFETSGHPKLCNHIQYRHHPYESHQMPCSQKLLK